MTKNKLPPYSVASEKIVIGSLLREPGLLPDVRAVLPEADAFFRPDYGSLYRTIGEVCAARAGTDTDADALIEAIVAHDDGDDETREALRQLAGSGQPAASALVHAKTIAEKARRRCLIAIVSDIIHEAYYSEEPTTAISQRAGDRLAALAPRDR